MKRLLATKAILWLILGGALAVAAARFVRGMGATTNLTDLTPWGFWIGFDVMGGVALAAGGFVCAATVYIFHLERYHAIVRPAVLTAFLGYLAVVFGLFLDLGLPWNIWHMIVFWNPHSPLFEVGTCVELYLTVLALEFAPVVLESARHPLLASLYKTLKKATIPLVILGIMLSTLHQSSLGSLILIMPHRLHVLWYTPILPILFFVSAVGLGLMMVTTESLVSSWLYEQEPELDLLQGLTKAASYVLGFYAVLRIGDVLVRGQGPEIFAGTRESWLWLVEVLVCAVIPTVLLSIPAVRKSRGALTATVLTGVAGFAMNRIDVGGFAQVGPTGTHYTPSWTEIWMSLGVVAGAALVYFFVAERFHLFHAGPIDRERYRHRRPTFDEGTLVASPDPYAGGFPRYTLWGVVGAGLAVALLPGSVFANLRGRPEPVTPAGYGDQIVIDGTRTSKAAVLFDHKKHIEREGGDASCARCHHLVFAGEKATGCARCHRDMYMPTDTFDHRLHAARLGAGKGCATCHQGDALKDEAHAKPCLDCHQRMVPVKAVLKPQNAPRLAKAPGYVPVMHKLCVGCHQERAKDAKLNKPKLGECATCHSGKVPAFDPTRPDARQAL